MASRTIGTKRNAKKRTTISQEMRERVCALRITGKSFGDIAKECKISKSSAKRIVEEQPSEVVREAREAGRAECAKAAWAEIQAALLAMSAKRGSATYLDCAKAVGILADKLAAGLDPDIAQSSNITGDVHLTIGGLPRAKKPDDD